ncbi:hypothetical protein SPLC1_S180220 [Arthrospira platensis C1]|nr:hypothetical protein SPLC1_S180220 [Arthrospira platensis C1]
MRWFDAFVPTEPMLDADALMFSDFFADLSAIYPLPSSGNFE